MAPIAGKKVLIVGGSSGLGFAVAKAALLEGAHVIIASSNPTKLEAAAKSLGSGDRLQWHVLDVSKEESFEVLFAKIGKVEHLVTTAGDPFDTGIPNIDLSTANISDYKSVFDIRYWGVIHAAQYAAKGFVTESFTCTSGTSERRPLPGWATLVGVAGAIPASSRGLALDLAPLRVNCISPGLVDTEMYLAIPDEKRKQIMAARGSQLPVKHVANADEIADAYIFAMKCTYYTGQTLYVDGGGMLV